jgi:leucyl-tRNA synthetase
MGLAYEDTIPINWCPSCKTGLANEEVEEGRCERCGTLVERRPVRQWLLRITRYADKLLAGLDELSWPTFILEAQRNWIGRSEGSVLTFPTKSRHEHLEPVRVFTTRADTLLGATYVVLAPEHPLVAQLLSAQSGLENSEDVAAYVREAEQKSDLARQEAERDKTGVPLVGVTAVNPVSGEDIPVWVADYVLMSYGTGAIMAVPAHDDRDFAFAQKFGLPIRQVITGGELPSTGEGTLMNSGEFDGMKSGQATVEITRRAGGERRVMYKLRDWVFSRQRYWGEPIPIIHCTTCGAVPVPEQDLPVTLPDLAAYEPTGTGESPLAAAHDWVNVACPQCGGQGKRETNTMPQWAGSSWYWLRYLDPTNKKMLASEEALERWLPVDLYVGGAEHAVLHLLYARFWSLALSDAGVGTKGEPFQRFRSVGLVLGADGQKMSKSRGNVVSPDQVVQHFGADAVRVYVMFMGPFGSVIPWSEESLRGARRFLDRVWKILGRLAGGEQDDREEPAEFTLKVQQTIKRVTVGTEQFRFNTAIAALMELLNAIEAQPFTNRRTLETFVLLLSPYAPHLAEDLWRSLGYTESLTGLSWPTADERVLQEAAVVIPVQVNGKVRGEVTAPAEAGQNVVEEAARKLKNVARYLEEGAVKKVIYAEGRMINFVVQ